MATAKHYVGDGSTDFGIEGGNTSINMEEISERLLHPYRKAVEAGGGVVMASFNSVHGIYMHAHKPLITDTLKHDMGFDGIVHTDWKGYSRFGENDVINAGKGPEVVVLLISGRPLVVTPQIEQSDAFVAAWLPGSEGNGIADVLFGDYNFTGKLPHSWPKSVDDFHGKFGPNFWNPSIEPLFEFGYGLNY